jgi:hypothetical protein
VKPWLTRALIVHSFRSMASLVAGASEAYCAPGVSEAGTGDLVVRSARHPVLEMQVLRGGMMKPCLRSQAVSALRCGIYLLLYFSIRNA